MTRFELIKRAIGCIPCLLEGFGYRVPEINHLLEGGPGGYRIGDEATVGECVWHHRGLPDPYQPDQAIELWGPSRRGQHKDFDLRYGGDEVLLAVQDYAIFLYNDEPGRDFGWNDFEMPCHIQNHIRQYWTGLMHETSLV